MAIESPASASNGKNKMNRKSFDLQAALAGAKVVTRDGREVVIAGYNKSTPTVCIAGWVIETGGFYGLYGWYESGRMYDDEETISDLFLAPQTHEGWINIYEDDCNCPERGCIYSMKENAESAILDNGDYKHIATIRIEWEE